MASGILIKLGHKWWARVRLGVSPDVFSISLNIPLLETMLNCVNESAKTYIHTYIHTYIPKVCSMSDPSSATTPGGTRPV